MAEEFSRVPERPGHMKPFALTGAQVGGKSNAEIMNKHYRMGEANELMRTCMLYAQSYSLTMVQRVLDEQPDFFDDKDQTKEEFTAHLQNNLCIGISKYRSSVFKDTQAKITDDGFTNDKIRRLVNGGDKFHPYL